jgi:excisionase family DNA binding protein
MNVTEREVCEVARVEVSTVRAARRAGELRCTRIGRYPRFAADDVRAWVEARKTAGRR